MLKKLKYSLSSSTRRAYIASWDRFSSFMHRTLAANPWQATPHHIALYITHLDSLPLRVATIRSHLSALAFVYKINGLKDPTDSFLVSKLLLSIKKSQAPAQKRLPITQKILKDLIDAIPKVLYSRFSRAFYKSMFSIMYYGCLRASEVSQSNTREHIIK